MPRLLYLADVQVEASQHGSALIFRALETYPADRLRIVETGEASQAPRRLPGVAYASMPIGRRRWLHTRFHGVYSAWLSWRAASRADRVMASLSDFEVEAQPMRPAAAMMARNGAARLRMFMEFLLG